MSDNAAQLIDAIVTLGGTEVLKKLNVSIKKGEIVSLLGKSGSGKSTTLRVLAGLTDLSGGELEIDSKPAVAFQQPRLFPWRKVGENVSDGIREALDAEHTRTAVEEILSEVELSEYIDVYPASLSGGQAQRVSLARALIAKPKLILLDEPFSALDALTREVMHRLLITLWKQHNFSVLLLTHDIDEAITLSDRIVILSQGVIAHETIIDPQEYRSAAASKGDARFAQLRNELLEALGI